jgi:hypothetical protein
MVFSLILNSQTSAPASPRRPQGGGDVAAALGFGGTSSDWVSTSQSHYLGVAPQERTVPKMRSPRSNLLGNEEFINRFSTTSSTTHAHPGISPRERRNIHSNNPSVPDHPFFGLHDPQRKMRLGPMLDEPLSVDSFRRPARNDYVTSLSDPPYPDTAHLSVSFDHDARMGATGSEHRTKYDWKYSRPMTTVKPVGSIVIA